MVRLNVYFYSVYKMLSKSHKCPKISRIIYLSGETAYLPLP